MRGSGQREEVKNAQESVFAGADHSDPAAGGVRSEAPCGVPGTRGLGDDASPLEVEVRWDVGIGREASEAARVGEPSAEESCWRTCRSTSRFSTRSSTESGEARRTTARWSMDFMADSLATARCFRMLNVVYDYPEENLAIDVDSSLSSSSGQGSRSRTALSRASTASFETSASTSTGLQACKTRGSRSSAGAQNSQFECAERARRVAIQSTYLSITILVFSSFHVNPPVMVQ